MQTNEINILPSGMDERQKFISNVNDILRLKDIVKSANESIKNAKASLYEQHTELFPTPLKKKDFNSKLKYAIDEATDAKATKANVDAQDGIEIYNIIKKDLI